MGNSQGAIEVLYNASIYTLNPKRPRATALAIRKTGPNGIPPAHILAVGSAEEILGEFGDRSKALDLEGGFILPGLTDAHVHLKQFAVGLQKVDCEVATREACLERIAERASQTQSGDWILGHGWAQAEWTGGFGTAAELDRVAPNNPVYLTAKSLHAGWANSLAMRAAGISAQTQDPPGGVIQRDDRGRPTGILLEEAMGLVAQALPALSSEALASILEEGFAELWKLGVTGVHDFDRADCFAALQDLHNQGKLGLRVVKSIPVEDLNHAINLGLRTGFGDEMLQIGAVKAFADGALGPKTAAMLQPYEGDPENLGILLLDREDIFEFGSRATQHGLSLAIHAIGDRANHETIAGLEQVRAMEAAEGLPKRRHRIEHVQVLHPEDLPRLARHEIVASMQPIHATSDMVAAERYWGARSDYAYAWRTLLNLGIHLAFGSDAPVESPNPFWGIHAAVTRQRADGVPGKAGWHPDERLSVLEAIHGFTLGPAYLSAQENQAGMLAEGFLADLVLVDIDPFKCEPAAIREILPRRTMLAGEWVYPLD